VTDPDRTKYNLEYYLDFGRQLVEAGCHVICVKDMAGLLKPRAARMLIGALREEFPDVPIHVHTHGNPSPTAL
jgi:pyruvate carboxylase